MSTKQLRLFEPSRRARFIGSLLHLANAKAPVDELPRHWFYALKHRLCRRFGYRVGMVYQQIARPCWSCSGTGVWRKGRWNEDYCWKCDGTGVYRRFWVALETWELGGYVFHRPVARQTDPPARVDIFGVIKHADYGDATYDAQLWLAVIFRDGRLLRALLVEHAHYRRWSPIKLTYPLLMAVVWASRLMRVRWAIDNVLRHWRCPWCGSPSWRGRHCHRTCAEAAIAFDEEVPF